MVTGAGSGLGRALCHELARRGARIVAADINLEAAQRTAAAIAPAEAHALRCDVARLDEVEALAAETDRLLGGVDLLINNAGVAAGGIVGEVRIENWQWIMGINLWGVIYGCHVFAPRLRKQRAGHILNVASAAGLLSTPKLGPYNVTKAGVVALSETMCAELRPDGVSVSVLCPTFFQTGIADAGRLDGEEETLDIVRQLMARARVQADDVARIALDAAARGDLYILPHRDGRWLWRLKRLHPAGFQRLLTKLLAWRAARRPGAKA